MVPTILGGRVLLVLVCGTGAARVQVLAGSRNFEDEDAFNETVGVIDEQTTLGFEQEWSKRVCTVNGNLDNHTLLFKTGHVRFTFETQGNTDGKKAQIEAISDVFNVGTRSGMQELDDAISEVEVVHGCLHKHKKDTRFQAMACKGLSSLIVEQTPATFKTASGKESKYANGLLFPQVTMTHKIGNIPRIFSQGYPGVEMSKKGNKVQRTSILKQSVACGLELMQTHIKTMSKRDVGYDDLHGFLVFIVSRGVEHLRSHER